MEEHFLRLFGNITISQIFIAASSVIFLYKALSEIKKYLMRRYDDKKAQEERLQKVIEQTSKYPEWRQQSLDIQREFAASITNLEKRTEENSAQIRKMTEENQKRELSKMFDRLLHYFRYYTSPEKNPMQAWTEMEESSFRNMLKDYEELGGNGYAHTEIEPKMKLLTKIPMHETEKVAELMHSRK